MKNEISAVELWGLRIHNIDYDDLYKLIFDSVKENLKRIISYSNVNTLNKIYKNKYLCLSLNQFDFLHTDGIGIFWAVNFIFPKNRLKKRITGSDFFPILIDKCIKENISIFFFGDVDTTLSKIKLAHPKLNISGFHNGYDYDDEVLIKEINDTDTDILIVGLGFPKQELWILKNKSKLNCKTIFSIGDGIKVFAGIKIRGPRVIRKLGFEWMVRLFSNPKKYWKRYIIGIPLFSVRIIKTKIIKLIT